MSMRKSLPSRRAENYPETHCKYLRPTVWNGNPLGTEYIFDSNSYECEHTGKDCVAKRVLPFGGLSKKRLERCPSRELDLSD